MSHKSGVLAAGAAALLAGAAAFGAGPALAQARDCDRACLTGVLDGYLAALAARDSSSLNLHYSVKYTENGQRLNLTDGLWRTFSSGPSYRLDVVDEEAGQIAMLGIVNENGNSNFFSVRIAVESNPTTGRGVEITEIENIVVRNNTRIGAAAMPVGVRPEFLRTVPESARLHRGELIRIANTYFTGLDTDESAAHVPFADTCKRYENGSNTANNPEAEGMAALGCAAQFDTGFSVIVTDIRQRRFPVVDRERGLVFALGFFDHDGAVESINAVDGQEPERMIPLRQPFSFIIAEVFQIDDAGRIDQIEAVLTTVPYKMDSGW